MKLTKVAKTAAEEIRNTLRTEISEQELEKITAIVAKAMEKSVKKVSKRNIEFCEQHKNPDTDIAHQIQRDIKRKQNLMIANLEGLR